MTEPKPRWLPTVVKQIKDEVPLTFPRREAFFKSMDSIADSYHYAAPELYGMWWGKLATILDAYLGAPHERPWKEKVAAIMSNLDNQIQAPVE